MKMFTLFSYFWLVIFVEGYSREGELQEYCLTEEFTPNCGDGNVVVMQSARYGHIKLGRCIDEDIGRLGCFLDQLSVLDKLCSGRSSCQVAYSDSLMEGQFPCTLSKSFARYLEASFSCQKVYTPSVKECTSSTEVPAASRFMYLSSLTTEHFKCGDESKPWIITAKEGQKINITFTDFNWKLKSRNEAEVNCPIKYGYLVDETSNDIVNLCGGLVRERNLYISKGNKVQILLATSVLKNVKFLIGYKAVGCPRFKAPANTWLEERDGYLLVGCINSEDQWKMRCIGIHWLGPLKDCTKYTPQTDPRQAANSQADETTFFSMPPAVAFSLFGGIFLVVGSIIVTAVIGIFCIRKSNRKSKDNFYNIPTMTKPTALVPMDGFATYKSVQVKLPQRKEGSIAKPPVQNDPFGSLSTLGSVPRHPPNVRESPHYYLLEGRDTTETEPLYDVVYQGSPTEQ